MKKNPNLTILILIVLLTILSCKANRENVPRNIILMIGDGMGLAHVYAAMTVSEKPLNIERCNITGLIKTVSLDSYITDSGAAGTALATGTKTVNGAISVDSLGKSLKSILEIAEDNGLATGLVSTSSITHATPASFIAHQINRDNYEDIARDFLKTDIDLFIGGGYNNFARRNDKLDLTDSLKSRSYEIDTSLSMVLRSISGKLAGFTALDQNPYRLSGRGDMLPASTGKAIAILSKNKKGFFLMVEGSQIDWAAQPNCADTLIDEVLDFDKAVGIALDYAQKDGHTLVVVTADHETGGVTVIDGDLKSRRVTLGISSNGHTAVMVPVFAYGPGAEKFTGIYDNTDIFKKINALFRFN